MSEPISNDDSGLANPSKHQPNALAGCAHALTGEQPREYSGDSEHKPEGNGKQERDLSIITSLICWSCKKPLTEKLDLDLAELPNRGEPMCGACRGQDAD